MGNRLGMVGLGRMGRAIAQRLTGQGASVSAWTRSGVSATEAEDWGVTPCATLADLAAQSDTILLSLFDEHAVRDVMQSLLQTEISGKLIIDTSTVAPTVLQDYQGPTVSAAASLMDAPISGGPELVLAGQCGVFAGGTAQDFTRAAPVLSMIAGQVHHVGPLGSGLAMKIVNNSVLQGLFAVLVDVMQIAKRSGLALEQVVPLLAGGPAGAPMLVGRVPRILGQDRSVGFDIDGASKDADVFVGAAHDLGLDVPTLEAAQMFWRAAQANGQGADDIAALISTAYEKA